MNIKKYRQVRVLIFLFVTALVILSVMQNSYLLAVVAVITGMFFLTVVKAKTVVRIDEREKTIREKAAQLTYAIFAPTIGIGAVLLLIPSYSGLSVFSKGEFTYLEALGIVFAYLALFLITIYAISYCFLNRKYGGGGNEE